jgi:hypothetical protein
MPKHKYFEELCALAPLGDLLPSQEQELEAHLVDCRGCRELSAEYLHVHRTVLEPIARETEAVVESSRNRVKSAMWANIALVDEERSREAVSQMNPRSLVVPSTPRYRIPLWAGTSAVAAIVVSFWLGTAIHRIGQSGVTTIKSTPLAANGPTSHTPSSPASDTAKLELQDQVAKLTLALKDMQHHSEELQQRLGTDDQELSQAIAAENSLREQVDRQAVAVNTTQAELDAKRTALEQAQSTNSSDGAAIANLELQVHDLSARLNTESASLDRERDLLAHGREIRDIIGARNLHIIDVYDTNTAGVTSKPFARAFYTEGKSLVYYAYDLPQGRADGGKFSYVAWGESNGNKASIKKIGILFHDNQTQTRWSLNFSDPQVLREIDSVFITLERTDEDLTQPKGKRMLTAYLGTAPNHP